MSSESVEERVTTPTTEETIRRLQDDIQKLQKELEVSTKLAGERLNQLKYLQADFDNYRKYFEREKQEIVNLADESLIQELLVVIDDFERALQSMESHRDREGLAFIYRNFLKVLENHGLKQIEANNKKFDPSFHEVVSREASDKEDGTVIEELQKGFMLKSKVLRPSKVKVAQNPLKPEGGKND